MYISSPHRKSSLDAVQYSIDELKARVPIWKKEIYKDGKIIVNGKKMLFKNDIE